MISSLAIPPVLWGDLLRYFRAIGGIVLARHTDPNMKFLLPLLLFLAAQAHGLADNIAYTIKGVLPASVAATSITDPNAAFTLSFSLPQHPSAPGPSINASSFSMVAQALFSTGVNTFIIPAAEIGFYSDAMGGGLFARLYNGFDHLNLSLGGPSLFSGEPNKPQLLAGDFAMDPGIYSAVGVNKQYDAIPNAFTTTTMVFARSVHVPEPGEALLSLAILGYLVRPAGKRTSSKVSAITNSSK